MSDDSSAACRVTLTSGVFPATVTICVTKLAPPSGAAVSET
jgi:hypothetical protein